MENWLSTFGIETFLHDNHCTTIIITTVRYCSARMLVSYHQFKCFLLLNVEVFQRNYNGSSVLLLPGHRPTEYKPQYYVNNDRTGTLSGAMSEA